jgi:hypothetical protein
MNPIATAMIAALSVGAASGVTDAAKKAIVDGYSELKTLIRDKFGSDSNVTDAIERLQAKPDSPGRQQTLAEELEGANACADPKLSAAAKSLLELVKALPPGDQHVQDANGFGIAQANHGSTATAIVFGTSKKRR